MKKLLTMFFLFLVGARSSAQLAPSDYSYPSVTDSLQKPIVVQFIPMGDTAVAIYGYSKYHDTVHDIENLGYLLNTNGDTMLATAIIHADGHITDTHFRNLYQFNHLQEIYGGQFTNLVFNPNNGEMVAGINHWYVNFSGTNSTLSRFLMARLNPTTHVWEWMYPSNTATPAPLKSHGGYGVNGIILMGDTYITSCDWLNGNSSGVVVTWKNSTTYSLTLGGNSIIGANNFEGVARIWRGDSLYIQGMNLSTPWYNRGQHFVKSLNQNYDRSWFNSIQNPADIFAGGNYHSGYMNGKLILLCEYYRTGDTLPGGAFRPYPKIISVNTNFTHTDTLATWVHNVSQVTLDTVRGKMWVDTLTGDIWVFTDPKTYSQYNNANGDRSMLRAFNNDPSLWGFTVMHNNVWSKPILHTPDGGTIDVVFAVNRALGGKLLLDARITFPNGDTAYRIVSQETPTVLPVTLTNFSGEKFGPENLVHFQTEAEVNISYYSVLKSEDGKNWKKFAEVLAHGGGFTAKYEAFDKTPDSREYYRLAIHGTDGKIEYSNIIVIERITENIISLYPSPTTDKIMFQNLNTDEVHTCKIFNSLGQIIKEEKNTTGNTLVVDVSQLASGMYFASIGTSFFNFVKQ